jgi:hypothetical protein
MPSGVVQTATSSPAGPTDAADHDFADLAVNDAMTADLQGRKAHHLIAPRPIPAALFFSPVAHISIHSASAAGPITHRYDPTRASDNRSVTSQASSASAMSVTATMPWPLQLPASDDAM